MPDRTGMSLQNRVDPFGNLHARPERGLFMGNRGGRFHDDVQQLGAARWRTQAWITCTCSFKGRTRKVWRDGYTELFFLDEVTALAAGHRPCFLCRTPAARQFQADWPQVSAKAADIDSLLHQERLIGHEKRQHRLPIDILPDGAMVAQGQNAYAICGQFLLQWDFSGYCAAHLRPGGTHVLCLTPPSTLAVLRAGYQAQFHPSAKTIKTRITALALMHQLD